MKNITFPRNCNFTVKGIVSRQAALAKKNPKLSITQPGVLFKLRKAIEAGVVTEVPTPQKALKEHKTRGRLNKYYRVISKE